MFLHKAAHVPIDARSKSGNFLPYLTIFRGSYHLQPTVEYHKKAVFYGVFQTMTQLISHLNYLHIINSNISQFNTYT